METISCLEFLDELDCELLKRGESCVLSSLYPQQVALYTEYGLCVGPLHILSEGGGSLVQCDLAGL